MGSECNPSKRRYDITMSKRTRKPLNMGDSDAVSTTKMPEAPDNLKGVVDQEDEENDHKSLKQLMKGNGKSKEGSRGRNSLGEHFTKEEKQQQQQLQLVKTQQQKGVQGLRFKGMVSRYAKVVSHLIKVKKRDPPRTIASRKNPLLLAFYNTTN